MIRPKYDAPPRPTKAEETNAYELATLRDRDVCQRCRRDCGPTARDHIQNRQAGNTIVENLVVLGLRCHQWKTEHPKDAIAEGWAAPSWADPREWPSRRWLPNTVGMLTLCWVLYDSVGKWRVLDDAEAERRMN